MCEAEGRRRWLVTVECVFGLVTSDSLNTTTSVIRLTSTQNAQPIVGMIGR